MSAVGEATQLLWIEDDHEPAVLLANDTALLKHMQASAEAFRCRADAGSDLSPGRQAMNSGALGQRAGAICHVEQGAGEPLKHIVQPQIANAPLGLSEALGQRFHQPDRRLGIGLEDMLHSLTRQLADIGRIKRNEVAFVDRRGEKRQLTEELTGAECAEQLFSAAGRRLREAEASGSHHRELGDDIARQR